MHECHGSIDMCIKQAGIKTSYLDSRILLWIFGESSQVLVFVFCISILFILNTACMHMYFYVISDLYY